MIDILCERSALGAEYRDVSVIVGDTHINIGNIETEEFIDVLEALHFDVEVMIRELCNEDFNGED